MNTRSVLKIAAAALPVGAAAYAAIVRPWHLRWGATDTELTESLPGDEVKPDVGIQVTHAVTIDAPPSTVWRWLVQIGQGRGGFYSYDELENLFGLEIHNLEETREELQQLKIGDFVRSAPSSWIGGHFSELTGWFVVDLVPEQQLVLSDEIEHGSWAFILRRVGDGATRLIVRVRGPERVSLAGKLLHYAFFEPAHFIMERKMLLTLKKLAERQDARDTGTNNGRERRGLAPASPTLV